MRSESRIPIVLDVLKEAWILAPDLRFNQLVSAINKDEDCFYMDDEIFLERIQEWIEHKQQLMFPAEKQKELIGILKEKYNEFNFRISLSNGDIFILHNNPNDIDDDFILEIINIVESFDKTLVKSLFVCRDKSCE